MDKHLMFQSNLPAFDSKISIAKTSIRVGLLAPEITTRGGIQSFMLRVTEVLSTMVKENMANSAVCFSLNDSVESLRKHPSISSDIDVWGGSRSKIKLIIRAVLMVPSFDVLLIGHINLSPVALVMQVLGRVKAYFVIIHGVEAWRKVSPIQRKALLHAKGIIATTRFTAKELSKLNDIPVNHFHIIPLCVDAQNVTPSANFKLNGGVKLLCVARQDITERTKGFEQLFQAIFSLKEDHPEIHLNLVGKGNYQHRLKEVADELGIANQVTFWGGLSDAELAAAYQDCDIFTMPSKKEGFGIVFLEAMRFGKPCIGGNHGGTPEVIEHGKSGFLVEYGDVTTVAEKIRILKENKHLQRTMGRRGYELIEKKFNFNKFQSSYEKLMI